MQSIQNLTSLVGTIAGSRPHPELPDYDLVALNIESAQPVEGLPSLLAVQPGDQLEVAVRRELVAAAGEGSRLHLRAKRTQDGAMSEPYPESGNFTVG